MRNLRLRSATVLLMATPVCMSAQGAPASLSGFIRDAGGQPLEGAVVIVVREDPRSGSTDSTGRYAIDNVGPGSVHLRIRRVGYTPRDTTVVLSAGSKSQVDVVLNKDRFWGASDDQLLAAGNDAAAGRIDSVGLGLLKPRPDERLSDAGFGRRLFIDATRRESADSNTVLSPLSAAIALSIARIGARGATAEALDRVLGAVPENKSPITTRGPTAMAALNSRSDVTLEIANAIWVDSSWVLLPSFQAEAAKWAASAASVPLRTVKALGPINHWADSVTHHRISRILDDVLPDTQVALITNAVYFKGKWLAPFDSSRTKPGDFTLLSGKRVTVPRMDRTDVMAYRRLPTSQVVRIPYRTGKIAMYIILPDSGASIDRVMNEALADDSLTSAPGAQWHEVHLVLPRMHSEVEADLLPGLKALGAGIALDCRTASFGGMARPRGNSPTDSLCINKAFQKVYLDVDEEGTEAAAITAIGIATVTSAPPPPIEFIVDRPFLFIIRDEISGADLFIGRIAKP